MEAIEEFIKVGSNDGSGYGCGSGFGDGYGYGCGDGNGSGYGSGCGSGDGSGFGDGSGSGEIISLNGKKVYDIDDTNTIIESVKGNVAKGYIVNGDLSLTDTWIAKEQNMFAHGETIHKAYAALQNKLMENMPLESRISKFKETFSDFGKKHSNKDLFEWHHVLTGSCEQGRLSFARDHVIDVENGSMTIYEFIELTKNSYNGEIIKKLLN